MFAEQIISTSLYLYIVLIDICMKSIAESDTRSRYT
jgi:hypothetical protein